MIIYPAIDLRKGSVVRLREGDPDQQTTFSSDPVATAQSWIDQGAAWLHIVNLDGAFAAANDNLNILHEIAGLGISVQFGGGLRSLSDVEQALNLGAKRVVLGTVAIKAPEIVAQALAAFGADAISVALDARDGRITTHGWTELSDETPLSLGQAMADRGLHHALYTDVQRDGGLSGANLEDTIALGAKTGLAVIASGGVSHIEEINTLAQSGVVAGAVIGMALYTNQLTLAAALTAAKG